MVLLFIFVAMNITSDQIWKNWSKLSKDEKINNLEVALDYMQQYNGRTKEYCIFRAMGYDNDKGLANTWYKL